MIPYTALNNGLRFPALSLGTYKLKDMERAVKNAIYAGYTAFDTASYYGNEAELSYAIAASGEPREELLITSKLWRDQLEYDQALRAFDESEAKLGKIDIMLIHWPCGKRFLPAWKALERIYDEKRVKAIGVSNFKPHHLETLSKHGNVQPVINQMEAHLAFLDEDTLTYCKKKKIQACAWSPLNRGRSLPKGGDMLLSQLSAKYAKNPAQIALGYLWQKGLCLAAKASSPAHLEENANIFDFTLDTDDMRALEKLQHPAGRSGEDPDQVL